MKKIIAFILAALLALSMLTAATAATYTDKDIVKKVQQALNDAGYNCGTPDGVAGKKTAAAITQYQTDKGLEATGTIDDALLQAMGIETVKSEAEAQDGADDVQNAPSEKLDIDPRVIAELYNSNLQTRLSELGVDSEIGQSAYMLNRIAGSYSGTESRAHDIYMDQGLLYYSLDGVPCMWITLNGIGEKEDDMQPLTFLEHAAAYAAIETINTFQAGTEEDLAGALACLGDAPSQDGTTLVQCYDSYICDWYELTLNGSGSKFEVIGKCNMNVELGNRLEDDDVPEIPEEIIRATGGIPEALDEQWSGYEDFDLDDTWESSEKSPQWNSDHYQGNISIKIVRKAGDNAEMVLDRIYITIRALDGDAKLYRWHAEYDESGNLLSKSYEY